MVKALTASTYVPTFLAEVGVGAMLPIFALSVLAMDGSVAVASLAVGAYALGRLAGGAWIGRLAASIGPARASMASLTLLAAGSLACALSPSVVPFVASALVVGAGHAAYHVTRQSQINSLVTRAFRARALTTVAGTWRVGNFIGPLVGAGIIAAWGLPWAYAFAAVMVVSAMVALRTAREYAVPFVPHPHAVSKVRDVVRESWPILRTLGFMVMLTGGVRAARTVVIPLWAAHVGVSAEVVSLIFAVSAFVDMLLFYPAGAVMDRWGRRWTNIPSTLMIAAGIIALPFTTSVVGVMVVALVLGLGNGWGSGSLMVLAADVAPPASRDTFTGVWFILQDVGGLATPLVVSAGAAIALSAGIFAVGGTGLVAALGMYRWIPPWRRDVEARTAS
ncbi:MAG: MFS transporter [Actinobacteria bacterium HGW-Actinobacteria-4]|nr:MAG: MFS transporter [Actinobacteria bacterium HGW-Actinobacteria-4]